MKSSFISKKIRPKPRRKHVFKFGTKCLSYAFVIGIAINLLIYGKLHNAFNNDFVEMEKYISSKIKIPIGTTGDGKSSEGSYYDPSKIMYLNVSDSSSLLAKEKHFTRKEESEQYSIDVLSIGSTFSVERAETQMKTWGSHTSRRHFWLATEFDDPDPTCHTTMTLKEVEDLSDSCRMTLGSRFWRKKKALNKLTQTWKNTFAKKPWLAEKKNPVGWICAQRRFIFALSKLLKIYREGRDKHGVDLPDYLIFGDDDTYVNLEIMEEQLLRSPNQEVKDKKLSLEDELRMVYPTQNTPVVWAGCRIRSPLHVVNDTLPFGGFGVLISKASIERFIQPLYCNETSTGFEFEACERFTPAYQNEATIGEYKYFDPGMSVSDLMGSYAGNINEKFCLHSGTSYLFITEINVFIFSIHVFYLLFYYNQFLECFFFPRLGYGLLCKLLQYIATCSDNWANTRRS
jgi:hypothetical protein